jgi:hypothetical protein
MRNHFFKISSLLLTLGSLPTIAQVLSSPATPDNHPTSTPTWTEAFPETNPSGAPCTPWPVTRQQATRSCGSEEPAQLTVLGSRLAGDQKDDLSHAALLAQ